ncbi:hypothetical protein [Paenibacillus herberti]|uniref:Copper amine oxidase n=1 Tax=Paenibacillus herberti TaxID=1619309 RepID=A0A229P0B4_9BACL|nr:hypothetical protein [Paenibacillus herberti]OXM15451.1 hypothetical protein CGZ75_01540 [Paenibacillus herberti]
MKKFVCGVLVGTMLTAGGTALASSTGLIGKKVQGVYIIEKDGKKLAEAAIIDGAAYAPVRAVAEASGADLSVEGKTISMGSEKEVTTQPEKSVSDNPYAGQSQKMLENSLGIQQNSVDSLAGRIAYIERGLPALERSAEGGNEQSKKTLESENAELADIKTRLEKVQAEIRLIEEALNALNNQ